MFISCLSNEDRGGVTIQLHQHYFCRRHERLKWLQVISRNMALLRLNHSHGLYTGRGTGWHILIRVCSCTSLINAHHTKCHHKASNIAINLAPTCLCRPVRVATHLGPHYVFILERLRHISFQACCTDQSTRYSKSIAPPSALLPHCIPLHCASCRFLPLWLTNFPAKIIGARAHVDFAQNYYKLLYFFWQARLQINTYCKCLNNRNS